MKVRSFHSWLLIALIFVWSAESVCAQSQRRRDLSLYFDGGKHDFNWSVKPEVRNEMKLKVREFLWEQWKQKRLGRISATYYTIEGDPRVATYYIEPDVNGRWKVVVESVSECCWFYSFEKKKRKRRRVREREIYDTVERVESKTGDKRNWTPVPDDENRHPSTYLLRMGEELPPARERKITANSRITFL